MTNAEYLTSSWSITSKSTLTIPNNLVCGVNNNRRMLDNISYIVNNSDIPKKISQFYRNLYK
jgi:hypothetical protein